MHTIEIMTDIDDSKLMYVEPDKWQEYALKYVTKYLLDSQNDTLGLSQDLSFNFKDFYVLEALCESNYSEWFDLMVKRAAFLREEEIETLILDDERVI